MFGFGEIRINVSLLTAFVMGDQCSNIGLDGMAGKFYQYGLIALALAASLLMQWYILSIAILIQAWRVMRSRQMSSRMQEVKKVIEDCPWGALHGLVRDSLELVKCTRMIDGGYDSRTNTNIILQEEKQQLAMFNTTQSEKQIISSVLAIAGILYRLRSVKRDLFGQQQRSDEGGSVCKIGCFRELFMAGKEMDSLIEDISELPILFLAKMKQPLLDPSSRHRFVDKCRAHVLPLLSQLSGHYHELEGIMTRQMNALKLGPQCQQYFEALTSDSYQEEQLQSLMDKVQYFEAKFALNKCQISIQDNYTLQLSEGNQQSSREISQQTQVEQSLPSQRRQFMKKLDVLLMMGLARRRQQQFQRKLQLLSESQCG